MRPLNLPADLVHAWAAKHAAANAKVEGRELPPGYSTSDRVKEYLDYVRRSKSTYSKVDVPPDESLKLRPVRNANGEIVTYVDD